MNLRRAAKLPVDTAMAAMLLWMMGYPVTRGLLRHGTVGCIVIGLFVLHHLLNLSWHRTLLRGRWSRLRLLSAAADILLIAAFAFLLASSLAMAGDVFPFAPFAMPWWGRDLHYASTAWIPGFSFRKSIVSDAYQFDLDFFHHRTPLIRI